MNLTKTLLIGSVAMAVFTSCNSDNSDPKYEMTIPRTMLVATANSGSSQVQTMLTTAKAGLDLYNNTTATFSITNVRMPNDQMVEISAGPMKYSIINSLGYRFAPQASTTFSGVSDPATFDFYMGGVNQINSRLNIVDGATTILGYSNTLYLFSSATITGNGSPVTTIAADKNVIQLLIQNGDVDRKFKATLFWVKPEFDNGVKIDENTSVGIPDLLPEIDPMAGTMTVTGGETPITPKLAAVGSSTLGEDMTEFKISNITFSVVDFGNNVGRLEFDFDYTPKPAEGESAVTTSYHFSAVLREAPEKA